MEAITSKRRIPFIEKFEHCKTDQDVSWYFITKAPDAEMIIPKPRTIKWFAKLGTVVFVDEKFPDGFNTRIEALQAAKEIHNQHSINLNLKPVYGNSKKNRRRNKRMFKSTYDARCNGCAKV